MNKFRKSALFVALMQAPFAFADNDGKFEHFLSLSLEDLMAQEITISTNTRQTLSKAPGVVSVITSDDIKATGAANLVDVLEGVPGIHVRANHFANRPMIQFRGANATQTLLMVNGVPLRDLMWGFGIFWKGLPVSIIERVEIIRGPGSAMFGSDASAGVINVITRTAVDMDGAEAGVRVGSFNSKAGWAHYGDEWGGYQVGMTAEVSATDGHDPLIAADRQSGDDPASSLAPADTGYGWRNQDLRFSVAKGHWRLLADYMRHSDLEVGLTGAGVLDPLTRAEDSRYNLDLLYNNERFSKHWELNAEVRYHHMDYDSGEGFQERPPGYTTVDDNGTPADPSDDITTVYPTGVINQMRSAERRTGLEVSGLYRGFSSHAIRLGAGTTIQDLYRVEQVITDPANPTQLVDVSDSATAFAPENARTINHLYLQDVWSIDKALELTAGARYDDYSDFGDTINPRLALVWKSSDRITTKMMYGEAFRAPSYQELFSPTSYAMPNPELDPERSQTSELALSYLASKSLQLGVNAFVFTQEDLIRPVGLPGNRKFQNIGNHTIRGIELEAQWQAATSFKVSGNVTYRKHDDSAYRAADEPDKDAYLRLDWGFTPNWNWNLQANWIGERPRSGTDTRQAVDAYLITDSTLRYAGYDNWEFATSVRNLFDVDARASSSLTDDLPLPERQLYAELRYQFGSRGSD